MTPIVIANWKMQLGVAESAQLATDLSAGLITAPVDTTVVVCPTHIALPYVRDQLVDGPIKLGAQDLFWMDRGAYTGEISALSMQEIGVTYTIVGHSERRRMGETDTDVARKTLAAMAHGIMPVVCIGESADDRVAGRQETVVRRQLEAAFRSTPPPNRNQTVYIAYEPIWAISPNDAADPNEAEAMRKFIRRTLIDFFPAELVESSFRVLYGGSVDADNVVDYVHEGSFKGALVGKASLQADNFLKLIQNVNRAFPG